MGAKTRRREEEGIKKKKATPDARTDADAESEGRLDSQDRLFDLRIASSRLLHSWDASLPAGFACSSGMHSFLDFPLFSSRLRVFARII